MPCLLSVIASALPSSCALRTSCCFGIDLLARFDIVVRNGLESVLNIQMSDMQWLQAYLPVREIGLDVRSVISLAPSAFLASALNTRSLQNEPIPHIASLSDADFDTCMAPWSEFSLRDLVTGVGADKQWIWDSMVVDKMKGHLFSLCETHLDTTRILAASALHAGDWLHVTPSANCGLFLKNKEVRIAVGVRLGAPACITYDCACGMTVDRLGLHCFSCKKCPGRYTRHSLLNDVVWRSFQQSQDPGQKGTCWSGCVDPEVWWSCSLKKTRWGVADSLEAWSKRSIGRHGCQYICSFLYFGYWGWGWFRSWAQLRPMGLQWIMSVFWHFWVKYTKKFVISCRIVWSINVVNIGLTCFNMNKTSVYLIHYSMNGHLHAITNQL